MGRAARMAAVSAAASHNHLTVPHAANHPRLIVRLVYHTIIIKRTWGSRRELSPLYARRRTGCVLSRRARTRAAGWPRSCELGEHRTARKKKTAGLGLSHDAHHAAIGRSTQTDPLLCGAPPSGELEPLDPLLEERSGRATSSFSLRCSCLRDMPPLSSERFLLGTSGGGAGISPPLTLGDDLEGVPAREGVVDSARSALAATEPSVGPLLSWWLTRCRLSMRPRFPPGESPKA
mmetsp:Transcript_19574/g.63735  ORF Transcript_19574/g.63735 Transcript_19574/m.63735 type:complete len:234 (-) Transcript_19574:2389-3090(-)